MDPNNTPNPTPNPMQPGTVFNPGQPANASPQMPVVDESQATAVASTPAFVQEPQPNNVDPLLYATSPAAPPLDQTYAPQQYAAADDAAVYENPDRSYLVALALAYFLGVFGADRFYLGRTKTAIIKLVTLGGLGVWALLDLYKISSGKLGVRADNRPLAGFNHNFHWAGLAGKILVGFNGLLFGGIVVLLLLGIRADMKDRAQLEEYNTSVQNQSLNFEATDPTEADTTVQ